MPADFDWAYLAGIIDGEGCISVAITRNGAYYLQLRISQKNKGDLKKLQTKFGGRLNSNSNTQSYQLHWYGRDAEPILRNILPYLIWKKDEAELAIAFIDQIMISRQGRGIKQNKSLAQFIKDELQAIKRWKYA